MDLTGYVTKSDDEECDPTKDTDCAENLGEIQIAGQSQKGPFVTGADVTAYELLNGRTLKQTGKTFSGKIEQANGSFNIKSVKLSSQFAYLVADGFYRNEVTGENSASSIKLRALTNLKGRQSANINLVTHLEYDRVSNLVTKKGLSVSKAKKQAETEIFAAFGINSDEFDAASKKGYAEDYNILNEGDGNAALLAISVMLQGDRTEAELTNLLASLSVDLTDSTWDNSRDRASVADWAFAKEFSKEGLESIRKNIENWKDGTGKKLATAVPAFEKYVKNFWRSEYKLGECSSKNANEIKAAAGNKYSAHYATCDSTAKEDESLTRFICVANGTGENALYAWREATDYEKDVAKLPAPTANAIASGMVNTDFVYVVEDGKWRRGTNLDAALKRSCIADSIGVTDSLTVNHELKWYICDKNNEVLGNDTVVNSWRTATTAEADTALFGIPAGDDPIARIGNVNKSHYYVYENDAWRYGTNLDIDNILGPCTSGKINLTAYSSKGAWYKCVGDRNTLVEGYSIPTEWYELNDNEKDTLAFSWLLEEDQSSCTIKKGTYSDTWYEAGKKISESEGKIIYSVSSIEARFADSTRSITCGKRHEKTDGNKIKTESTGEFYVYDSKQEKWIQSTSVQNALGIEKGCTMLLAESGANQDEAGKLYPKGSVIKDSISGEYNLCKYYNGNYEWVKADSARWQTYGLNCDTQNKRKAYKGTLAHTDAFNYVCEADTFRVMTKSELWAIKNTKSETAIRCSRDDEDAVSTLKELGSKFVCKNRLYEWDKNIIFESYAMKNRPDSDYGEEVRFSDAYDVGHAIVFGTRMWNGGNIFVASLGDKVYSLHLSTKIVHQMSLEERKKRGSFFTLNGGKAACAAIYNRNRDTLDFRLPTYQEYLELFTTFAQSESAAELRSTELWNLPGTNSSGFNLYPFGYVEKNDSYPLVYFTSESLNPVDDPYLINMSEIRHDRGYGINSFNIFSQLVTADGKPFIYGDGTIREFSKINIGNLHCVTGSMETPPASND